MNKSNNPPGSVERNDARNSGETPVVRKPYSKPVILFNEPLEAAANLCEPVPVGKTMVTSQGGICDVAGS